MASWWELVDERDGGDRQDVDRPRRIDQECVGFLPAINHTVTSVTTEQQWTMRISWLFVLRSLCADQQIWSLRCWFHALTSAGAASSGVGGSARGADASGSGSGSAFAALIALKASAGFQVTWFTTHIAPTDSDAAAVDERAA
jgi:hypothetical protein